MFVLYRNTRAEGQPNSKMDFLWKKQIETRPATAIGWNVHIIRIMQLAALPPRPPTQPNSSATNVDQRHRRHHHCRLSFIRAPTIHLFLLLMGLEGDEFATPYKLYYIHLPRLEPLICPSSSCCCAAAASVLLLVLFLNCNYKLWFGFIPPPTHS